MVLFKVNSEHFDGVVKVVSQTNVFEDERGFFAPSFRADDFERLGLPTDFVQDNHSRSAKNVIRGLHFQLEPPMGKLMRVTRGEAFLVAVDIRPDSETFLKWIGITASESNRLQLWAPAGFARGFCALSDVTDVQYKCTGLFDAVGDTAIRWNDPTIGVEWPVQNPIVSRRDQTSPLAADFFQRTY